jgi:hypothetical protein
MMETPMATSVGNEENFTGMMRNLILLGNDTVAAHDSTIERLSDPDAISRIKAFRQGPVR